MLKNNFFSSLIRGGKIVTICKRISELAKLKLICCSFAFTIMIHLKAKRGIAE